MQGENGLTFIHVTPESSIYFPSADKFKGIVSKALYSQPNIPSCTVVIHGDNIKEIDYTTAMGIKNMVKGMRKDNAQVLFQVTESSAVNALNCLEDSVRLCIQEDEIKHSLLNSASNTCTEVYSDGNEVLEGSDPLLNKYNVDQIEESSNTKDNQTQES
ncbi:hypothetical protein AVEN_218308-1 [Araneus ventricosus]|uniref:STAS domain-containing protein n=1 Tax=Araneus ventricosus TaxID=182803 RepID=A0A4Y2QFY3_ARAVE|nr:hypothetical protein AVEN_218308-1 [Araneus ventricosus]